MAHLNVVMIGGPFSPSMPKRARFNNPNFNANLAAFTSAGSLTEQCQGLALPQP
jgi:hypothetical protein